MLVRPSDQCSRIAHNASGSFAIGFFKGTSTDQDRRFSDKEMKLLKSMKFPPEFDKKVCDTILTFEAYAT